MFGAKDCIAVVNFLATKVEVSIAQEVINDNVRVLATGFSEYAGFIDGEFLEPDNVFDAVLEAYNSAINIYGKKVDNLYIGVPTEFCNYALKNLKANYTNKIVIKKRNIDELFASIEDNAIDDNYTVISKSPIYYVLDDGVQTMDPVDSYSKNLGAKASYILANNCFIDIMHNVINALKIKDFCFVPIALAVNTIMLSQASKQSGAIIIDFGYVSTSITSIVGEGLVDIKTFGVGDGHILADLAEVLKLDYYTVEELKKQIILTLEPNQLDNYEVTIGANTTKISAHLANDIIKARLDSIADIITNILFTFQYKQDRSLPIYLTGSGVSYIRGAKNYLSKILNRKCEIIAPKQVEYNDPKYSNKISLINFVFKTIR